MMLSIKMISAGLAVALMGGLASGSLQVVKRADVGDEVYSVLAEPTNYCETFLYHVNSHRLNHSAPLIPYNRTLEAALKNHMQACDAPGNAFPGSLGVTLSGGGSPPSGINETILISQLLSTGWYSETDVAHYANLTNDFTCPPSDVSGLGGTGFTRMVWKSQQSFACFALECGPGTGFFNNDAGPGNPGNVGWTWNAVCAFYPGGNTGNATDYFNNVSAQIGLPGDDVIDSSNFNDNPTC